MRALHHRRVYANSVSPGDVIDLEGVPGTEDNAEVVRGSRAHYWLVLAAVEDEEPDGLVRMYVAPRLRLDDPADLMQIVVLRTETRLLRVGTNQHLRAADLELAGQY